MAIKFLSGLNLSNVTAGSILKLDSNGNIVAATAGTDYATSNLWTTTSSDIYRNSSVRIGTYQTAVAPDARLHVFDYQTTDPKILIEDGNTGDASMQFKISTQSYTMGIDNSDSDKFVFAASSALGTTNVLEVATNGTAAFQTGVLFNTTVYMPGSGQTADREALINAHGTRAILYKQGNAAFWQVAQGGNQFEIVDAANGNSTKGNVMLRVSGNDADDNQLHLALNGGKVGINTSSPTSSLDVSGVITTRNSSLLRRYVSTWTNADTHDILYNGWAQDMGDYVYLKAQGNSTGDHGMLIVGDNVAYIGRSNVETGAANSGLDTTWATFSGTGVGIGTTSPAQELEVVGTIQATSAGTATLILRGDSGNVGDTGQLDSTIKMLHDDGNHGILLETRNYAGAQSFEIKSLAASVETSRFLIDTDGTLKIPAYGAGFLTTDANGDVSVDTSTYLTSVDWSDIGSINGTINVNSTTQIGQGDTETLVSFQNSGTERGSFQVDDSANSYFVATGFKTATASTGFLKANGTVDTSTYLTSVAFSDITSKPTTLSGYGITDGATVDYVDTEVSGLASESWANTNLVNVTGDTMTGDLTIKRGHGDLTFLTLKQEDTSGDLVAQKSFIDFTFVDSNTNETPQVRIGAEVGNNDGSASSLGEEGMGAFVVYTNNADTDAGAAGTSLAERLRVDRLGRVGIGSSNPAHPLHVVGDIYTTSDFRGNSIISTNAALSIDNTGIQPAQGEVEDIVAFKFSTTKVAHVDTDGYISAAGFKTNTASTGFLKANGTVDTSTYLTSYTETDTLNSVTGRGATTTNNISVGNLTAVGGTFTDPVTIYDSTTTENPRLSVGRNAGESIQFGVTDVVNTITAKQDSDSDGDHTFVLDRVFAGAGDSIFSIHNDGTPDLTIDGSGVVSFNQYNTAGILQVNTSGTISVDTSSYLTSVAFSDLTSKPTTLSGYGIIDGASLGTDQIFTGDNEFEGDLLRTNQRVSTNQEYPLGHYTPGETVFELDPTWSNRELRQYFGNDNVSWDQVANAPGGYAVYIDGSVSVGGAYGSGFPYIPIDQDGIYYMECWILNAGTAQGHYMGSIDYEADFTAPASGAGNPGSYGYWVMSNYTGASEWTKVDGYITGHHNSNTGAFETDATYWTPQALFNYSAGTGDRACWISGWKVIRVDHVGNRTFQNDVYVKGKLEIHTLDTNTASTTALVMNGNEVEKRTLGSNAFNSTSYLTAESDTLSTVVSRGASTTTAITTGGITADYGYFGSTSTAPQVRITTENNTASIADTFADTSTDKSYIYFMAGTNSNDPGYIMHETSETASPDERNEGVLHLVPSDDNSTGDYVSIHGTNDADVLKLHTSGLIETATGYQLVLKSGNASVKVDDTLHVTGRLYVDTLDANTSSTSALVEGSSGEIEKRTLGSLAFDSTTLGTAASQSADNFVSVSGDEMTGDLEFRNNVSEDNAVIRNIEFNTSAAQGSDDRAAIIRAYTSGGTAAERGGQMNFYTRKPSAAGFNNMTYDNAGNLYVPSNVYSNSSQLATQSYVTTAISNLVDSAPAALDTLNELAAALGDDASFSTTMSTALGNRLRIDVNNQSLSSTELSNARTNLGLGTAATSAATDFVAVSGDTMTGNLTMSSATPTLKFSINGAENNAGIVWEDGDAGDPSTQAAAIKWSASDNHMRFYNNDESAERFRLNGNGAVTFLYGINGFTNSYGISGSNYNITGVNQIEIADPGEGIIWKNGTSGDMTLAVVDDTADNILRFSGTNAVFDVAGDLSSTNLTIADSIIHEGDADTKISFTTDVININTGGGVRASISNSTSKFNNDVVVVGGETLSLGERAEGDDLGRTVLIEGIANAANGEGSGRIFFSEHNSTTAAADSYGLSLYYEGDPNAQLPSGFQPNTGNATWSLRRHDNSVNGVAIMSGSRSSSDVTFSGSISATSKSFDIEHPTKEGKRLVYGSLEGAEHGVYFRGKGTGEVIELPEHWTGLVHEDSITVQLTPIGKNCVWVEDIKDNAVYVGMDNDTPYFYFIQGERKDIDKLIVEQDA